MTHAVIVPARPEKANGKLVKAELTGERKICLEKREYTPEELEADGLIRRREYPQIPPKVEYSLSEKGKSLIPILDEMCDWGEAHRA